MLARAASHALNYAPLNYEWHEVMEIINGVRFADTNEEPARRGLLHTLMRISRRLRNARAARCTYNKVVFRYYRPRLCLLFAPSRSEFARYTSGQFDRAANMRRER